jgi:predicted ATPase
LKETLRYPLPGSSTLQHWAANIHLRHGVLEDVLQVMEIAGNVKSNFQRTTVLCFDEMKVSGTY